MSLVDLITGNAGSQVASDAENKFGVSKNQVIALLVVAAPLIISYLKNKSKDAKEAEALNSALDKDHDGSILSDPSQAIARESEGNSILSHIFGNDKANVENQLSQSSGISIGKLAPVLAMLAPLIMGYIGKQKQQSNVSAGGLGDLLGGILGNATQEAQASSNPISDILGKVLGGTQTQASNSNPLNDLLGSVLGSNSSSASQQQGGLGSIFGNLFGGK